MPRTTFGSSKFDPKADILKSADAKHQKPLNSDSLNEHPVEYTSTGLFFRFITAVCTLHLISSRVLLIDT
jgi:hypothetical protein